MTIIDCHSHTFCPTVNVRVADTYKPEYVPYQRDMSDESKAVDHAQFPVLGPKFNNLLACNPIFVCPSGLNAPQSGPS